MFQYFHSGDSALIIKTGNEISLEINQKIRALLSKIEQENISGIVDFIPSYNELMVCYDPLTISFNNLLSKIKNLSNYSEELSFLHSSTIVIPVVYGGDFGPDLI
jgi:inhibitor of KinA